jgi:hypothetical protein
MLADQQRWGGECRRALPNDARAQHLITLALEFVLL